MSKFQNGKGFKLVFTSLLLILLGCETPSQNNTYNIANGYTQLNQHNPKDQVFYMALQRNLQSLGALVYVYVNTEELNLYREGKRPYPTNYLYGIKANSNTSLEMVKQANLNTRK